ncbi:hypothetical protein AC579_10371 [Pseudocercospora musae]|uniref:Uncharacterized protein n=1 Tax=Pseudocercospora musae TaxID=113226 RepID=A0A139GUT9_9PEZI|nr:hypothetical protein AC579_10371 [Pseudocercospora musae]
MAGSIELRFRFCPKYHPGNPFRKLNYLSVDLKGVSSQRDLTTRLNEVFKNEYTDNGKLFRFQLRPGEDTVSFHELIKSDHPCSQDLSLASLRAQHAFRGHGENGSKGEIVFLHIHFKDKASELPKSPKSPKNYKPLWESGVRKNQGRAITPKTTPQKRKTTALAKKLSILSLPKHIIKFRLCQYNDFVRDELLEIDITECETWHDIRTTFWNQMTDDIVDFLDSRHNSIGLHFHQRILDESIRDRRLCIGDPVMLDMDGDLDVETFKVMYCWVEGDDCSRFDRDVNNERLLSVHFDARPPSPKRSSGPRRQKGGIVSPRPYGRSIPPLHRSGSRTRTPSNPTLPVNSSLGGIQRRGNSGSGHGTPSSHFPGDPTSPLNSYAGGSQRAPSLRPASRQGTGSLRTPHGSSAASSRDQSLRSISRQGSGPARGQSPTSPQYSISSRGQRSGSGPPVPNSRSSSRQGTGSPYTPHNVSSQKSSSSRSQRNESVPRTGSSRGPTPTRNDSEEQLLEPDEDSDLESAEEEPNEDARQEPEPSPTLDTDRPEDEITLAELHKESRKRKASDAGLAQPLKAVKLLDVDDGRRYVRIGKVTAVEDMVEAQDDEEDSNPKLEVILVAVIHPRGARGSSKSSVQYLTVNTWLINGSRIGAWQSASEVNPKRIKFQVDPFWAVVWKFRKPEKFGKAILDWAFHRRAPGATTANAPKEAPLRLEHSLGLFVGNFNVEDDDHEEIDVVITFVNTLAKTHLGLPEYMHAALDNDETCGTFKSYLLDNVVSSIYRTLDHMLNDDDSGFNFWGDIKVWVLPQNMEKTMYEWKDDGTFAEEFLDNPTVEAFGKRQLYIEVHLVEAEDARQRDREWKERMKGRRPRAELGRREEVPRRRVREIPVETRDDDSDDDTFLSLGDLSDD